MASKYEYFHSSTNYCGCCYSERGYYEGYPESFERKSKDTATVKVRCKAELCRTWVRWAVEGRYKWTDVYCDGNKVARSNSTQWNNCSGNWGNCDGMANGTWSFTQTSYNKTSVSINGRSGYQTSGGETTFWWDSENGWSKLTVDIGNNFRILPPKNLTGSVTSKTTAAVTATCSLGSWSDNSNIGGTPYTSGGGRTWNFRAILKNGSTTIATLTQNTGETKSATFNFTGLNLPVNTNLTVEFTASNNYQQTTTATTTFKIESLGLVITSSSSKHIKYMTITYPYDIAQDDPSLAPLAGVTKYIRRRVTKT